MQRRPSEARSAWDRSAADYRRRQLDTRLPSNGKGVAAVERTSVLERAALALGRHSDNPDGTAALKAMMSLPGLCMLDTKEQLALIATVDGPAVEAGAEKHRRWMAKEVWKTVQKRIANELAGAADLPHSKQADLILSILREPRDHATLLTAQNGHAVLALMWKPRQRSALLTYGRWPTAWNPAHGGPWGWVKSPDVVMGRGFLPVARALYEYTVHRVSIDDCRQLIEWMERAFAVNQLSIGPREARAYPMVRSFVKYVLSDLTFLGRGREAGGRVDQGYMPAGQLLQGV